MCDALPHSDMIALICIDPGFVKMCTTHWFALFLELWICIQQTKGYTVVPVSFCHVICQYVYLDICIHMPRRFALGKTFLIYSYSWDGDLCQYLKWHCVVWSSIFTNSLTTIWPTSAYLGVSMKYAVGNVSIWTMSIINLFMKITI